MAIKGDLLIQGGTVVDPASEFLGKGDILIRKNKIIDIPPGEILDVDKKIDATGCLVLPGLIDYHTHVFHSGTGIGVYPDSALLPQGVTTAVDQGSAGVSNYESFFQTVISHSQVRIFSHLHASPAGLATLPRCLEEANPEFFNLEGARALFEKYNKNLIGIKIRQSSEIVGKWGLTPLKATVSMANELGCRVVVHTTNPPGNVEELVSILRPGDVFTHVYQGKGSNIINEGGEVRLTIREARARGVLFDTADGRGHYAFSVAKKAIADGFNPDIISTDLVRGSLYDRSVFGLPLIMSKYLELGVSLQDVIKACTSTPARIIGLEGKIGTLAPGAFGDVAIFKLKNVSQILKDVFGEVLHCNQIFIPQMTIINGKTVYMNLEFL